MEPLSTLTIPYLLERSVRLFEKRDALRFVDEPAITYFELKKQVEDLAGFLQSRGIAPGDRAAILGENSPHWGIAYFAITSMGAVVVPILPEFHATEVQHILHHSGAKAVFVSERYSHKLEGLDLAAFSVVVLLDDLSVVIANGAKSGLKRLLAEGGRELSKMRGLARRLAGREPPGVQEDDLCSIIYTSGTMGRSKGVMLTHRNIVWNAHASAQIPPVSEKDRLLSILPLAHVYECTLGLVLPVMQGASVSYLKKLPTPTVLLPALAAVRPTMMLTVPLIIEKVYKSRILPTLQGKRALRILCRLPGVRRRIYRIAGKRLMAMFGGNITFFGIGGAALSAEVERFLREAQFPYAIGYGLTETAPLIAGANATNTRYRSTGPVVPGLDVRIENPDQQTGDGEIVVRGPSVMKGYYQDPAGTAEVLTDDGWFRTGDLGCIDAEGYLYIKGRLKNVIIGPSGENIYPEAVEAVIDRVPYVLDSIVLQEGRQLVARVHFDYEKLDHEFAQQNLSEEQIRKRIDGLLQGLRREVNHQVASFSRISKVIEQTEPFDKTPTQKIKRYLYTK